jgi:hypothetical protein
MMALEVFAIYMMPFSIIGLAIRFLMKRYAVDLPDVEKQVGPKPRRRFLLELGAPKIKAATVGAESFLKVRLGAAPRARILEYAHLRYIRTADFTLLG